MSFQIVEQATPRLQRSELAVPGNQTHLFEKAAASQADVVFLDLEDSVAPQDKPKARADVVAALNDNDWTGKCVTVRINGLDTHFMYRDVIDVMEQAAGHVDMIMIPKVGTAADVYAVDMLITQIEMAKSVRKRVGFSLIIETALGMNNISDIASASPRTEALHFGVADFAASTKAQTTNIGGANPDYAMLTDAGPDGRRERHWGDMWHFAIAPHGGCGACQWVASDRRTVRRFLRLRRVQSGRTPRSGPRLRGQVGHTSVADSAGERNLQPVGSRSRQGPPYPARPRRGAERRPWYGIIGWSPDRPRLGAPSGSNGQKGRGYRPS